MRILILILGCILVLLPKQIESVLPRKDDLDADDSHPIIQIHHIDHCATLTSPEKALYLAQDSAYVGLTENHEYVIGVYLPHSSYLRPLMARRADRVDEFERVRIRLNGNIAREIVPILDEDPLNGVFGKRGERRNIVRAKFHFTVESARKGDVDADNSHPIIRIYHIDHFGSLTNSQKALYLPSDSLYVQLTENHEYVIGVYPPHAPYLQPLMSRKANRVDEFERVRIRINGNIAREIVPIRIRDPVNSLFGKKGERRNIVRAKFHFTVESARKDDIEADDSHPIIKIYYIDHRGTLTTPEKALYLTKDSAYVGLTENHEYVIGVYLPHMPYLLPLMARKGNRGDEFERVKIRMNGNIAKEIVPIRIGDPVNSLFGKKGERQNVVRAKFHFKEILG